MGTHGRGGVQRLWLGSVAERVIRLSPRPVMAIRHSWPQTGLGSILCPVSCSDAGFQAFEYAAATAKAEGARLLVLHSAESTQLPAEFRAACDRVRAHSELEEMVVRENRLRKFWRRRTGGPRTSSSWAPSDASRRWGRSQQHHRTGHAAYRSADTCCSQVVVFNQAFSGGWL